MMQLPEGFGFTLLFGEYIDLAIPFIAVGAMFAFYIVVQRLLSRGL